MRYRYKYHLTKMVLISIFWGLDGIIAENWIFLICGAALPFLDLFISKDNYVTQFPWELYLIFAYIFFSLFVPVEPHLIFLGIGYALARMVLYFQLKSNTRN